MCSVFTIYASERVNLARQECAVNHYICLCVVSYLGHTYLIFCCSGLTDPDFELQGMIMIIFMLLFSHTLSLEQAFEICSITAFKGLQFS